MPYLRSKFTGRHIPAQYGSTEPTGTTHHAANPSSILSGFQGARAGEMRRQIMGDVFTQSITFGVEAFAVVS